MGYNYDGFKELRKQDERLADIIWRKYFLINRFDLIRLRIAEIEAPYIDETKGSGAKSDSNSITERIAVKKATDHELNQAKEIVNVCEKVLEEAEENERYILSALYDFTGTPPQNRRRDVEVAKEQNIDVSAVKNIRKIYGNKVISRTFNN